MQLLGGEQEEEQINSPPPIERTEGQNHSYSFGRKDRRTNTKRQAKGLPLHKQTNKQNNKNKQTRHTLSHNRQTNKHAIPKSVRKKAFRIGHSCMYIPPPPPPPPT